MSLRPEGGRDAGDERLERPSTRRQIGEDTGEPLDPERRDEIVEDTGEEPLDDERSREAARRRVNEAFEESGGPARPPP